MVEKIIEVYIPGDERQSRGHAGPRPLSTIWVNTPRLSQADLTFQVRFLSSIIASAGSAVHQKHDRNLTATPALAAGAPLFAPHHQQAARVDYLRARRLLISYIRCRPYKY